MSKGKNKAADVEVDGRMIIHDGVRYRRRDAERRGIISVTTDASGPAESRARTSSSQATSEGSSTPPVGYRELQAKAKELGVPASGSAEELTAAIAAAEAAKAASTDGGASGDGDGSGDGSGDGEGE